MVYPPANFYTASDNTNTFHHHTLTIPSILLLSILESPRVSSYVQRYLKEGIFAEGEWLTLARDLLLNAAQIFDLIARHAIVDTTASAQF
jgi:hypothetical protein